MNNDTLEKLLHSASTVIKTHGGKRTDGKVASIRTQEYTTQVVAESCRRLHKLGYYLSDVKGIQQKHIDALVKDWHEQGLSNKTMQNQFSRLKVFCGWNNCPHLVERGGFPLYLPHVDPKQLKVSAVAMKSKSWTENGIDIMEKIKEARLQDQRHAAMLILGIAFGLRKKEMLRIKPWKADKGHTLDIDGSVAKNGRFRSIPLEAGEFGVAQRWALDAAKAVCGKLETLGWPGLTYKQSENRYYHYMTKLQLTKFDAGITGHGARAEYAENMLLLKGLMPPTLGGAVDQLTKHERQEIITSTQQKMGHNDPHAASAYFGTFRNFKHVDGLGGRIGTVLVIDVDKDIFALVYANPAPVKLQDGSYKIKTEEERQNTAITVVVERPSEADQKLSLNEFAEQWPSMSEKVHRQLVIVGFGQ